MPPTTSLSGAHATSEVIPTGIPPWKSLAQASKDLELIKNANYNRICLFDLMAIRDFPDPAYRALLRNYAKTGTRFMVYVQDMTPDQAVLDLLREIGADATFIFHNDASLIKLLNEAGITTYWWSGVAFPEEHMDQPQYMDWPDLRSDQVRQVLSEQAVEVPTEITGGLNLDYIRWKAIGQGRTASQVTDLLQKIRDQWKGRGSLSAAVYPYLGKNSLDGGAISVGQEWNRWLKAALVDFVIPMAYDSQDIPWLINQWKIYDQSKIVPCLSIKTYDKN